MMPFFVDWPLLLWLTPILAIGVAALVYLAGRRRVKRLRRIALPAAIERLVPPAALRSQPWRAALLGTAAACAGLALAGPRWGTESAVVRGTGADIVLALDVSLSMFATDDQPSRLERMRQEARRLVAVNASDRFGIIAFAGRSYILTPLTVDRGALELYLDNLDPSIVGQPGSSIARAIRQGTDLLMATQTGSDRAIVLMSDGEAWEPVEEIAEAARRATQAGIQLVTVGFGTEAGGNIPVPGGRGTTELHRDQQGQVVVTRYMSEYLEAAAQAGNGVFIGSGETDKASRIASALSPMRREARRTPTGTERRPRFQLFLIPAVLLVLLDTVLAERRGRMRVRAAAATPATAMLLLMLLPFTMAADPGRDADRLFREGRYAEAAEAYERAARARDASPRVLYNYGTALLLAGRADDAAKVLERAAASEDEELRYRSTYNLGLLHLERARAARDAGQTDAAEQAFNESLEAYRRALRLRSGEADAKWNYELALRERRENAGGGGGGGGGGAQQPDPQPEPSPQQTQAERPAGALDQQRAEQILNSAAREERDVQGRRQRTPQTDRPRTGRDW